MHLELREALPGPAAFPPVNVGQAAGALLELSGRAVDPGPQLSAVWPAGSRSGGWVALAVGGCAAAFAAAWRKSQPGCAS